MEVAEEEKLKLFSVEEACKNGFGIFGSSGSGKTNAGKVLAKELMEAGCQVLVFDSSKAWNDFGVRVIPCHKGEYQIRFGARESVVLDMSELYVSEQRQLVQQVCRGVFEARVKGNWKHWMFVVFEEAQTFLGNHSLRSRVYEEVMRLVSVGRNFKIRFGAISQFPAYIDKLTLKLMGQRYFGYTSDGADKEYIRRFIGEEAEKLDSLEVGEFVYDLGKNVRRVKFPLFSSL